MERDRVQDLYGGSYAESYDALWQENEVWAPEAGHYVRSLGEHIHESTRWLDVGCGTGWFLSRFPGVTRAGVDLSPDMLAQAEAKNPDALFLRQGDIRDDVAEWHGAWDLVSSTGQAWGYVDGIDQVRQVADNMARWTSPEGVCLVQPGDITDLTGLEIDLNYEGTPPPLHSTVITGVIWTFYDEGGAHVDQVYPSVDVWVQWLSRHFAHIEVVRWPHDPPAPYLKIPRRLIVARDKRGDGDTRPTEIVVHTVPDGPTPRPRSRDLDPSPSTEVATTTAADRTVGPADEDEAPPPAGERIPGRRLVDQPLSYLIGRVRPLDPGFWRSAGTRLRGRVWR